MDRQGSVGVDEEGGGGVPGSVQTQEPPDAIGFQEQTHPGVAQDPPHVPKPPPQTEEEEKPGHPGPWFGPVHGCQHPPFTSIAPPQQPPVPGGAPPSAHGAIALLGH